MNNKKAKKLRSILPVDNEVSRRAYRRAKKLYNRLPAKAKNDFIEGLEEMFRS
jgi:hypothetical protein